MIFKPKNFWFPAKQNVMYLHEKPSEDWSKTLRKPTCAEGKRGLLACTWGRTTPGASWGCPPDPEVTTGAGMLKKLKSLVSLYIIIQNKKKNVVYSFVILVTITFKGMIKINELCVLWFQNIFHLNMFKPRWFLVSIVWLS